MDISEQCLQKAQEVLTLDDQEQIEVAGNAARALWSLSQSNHNKADMQRSGIIGLLPKLLKAKHQDIVVQTMGMLQNCGNLVSTFQTNCQIYLKVYPCFLVVIVLNSVCSLFTTSSEV